MGVDVDLATWIRGADMDSLLDLKSRVDEALERKWNEERIALLRVVTDGLEVGYFAASDMAGALGYLAANVDKSLGEVRIERRSVPKSEVDELLRQRWW